MPEVVEVRLTAEYLHTTLKDRAILEWGFVGGRYTDDPPTGFYEFDDALPLMVESVQNKGKFVYFTLYNEDRSFYILHSLMMTGRWQEHYDDHCKWYLELDNKQTLWFRDPRAFATLRFTTEKEELQEKLDSLGPDILTENFTLDAWRKLTHKYANRNITAFLMDQSVIAGCGNYIKAEVLYYAGVSPLRKVGDLKEHESEKVFEGLRIIPRISYNKKGLSLKDYADEHGVKGEFEDELEIYGKKHAKRTKTADGRTTHWDPSKQK